MGIPKADGIDHTVPPGGDHHRLIVAEISKTWPGSPADTGRTVSRMFELVITANSMRGYDLDSWQFRATAVPNELSLVETIIAVFKKRERSR